MDKIMKNIDEAIKSGIVKGKEYPTEEMVKAGVKAYEKSYGNAFNETTVKEIFKAMIEVINPPYNEE